MSSLSDATSNATVASGQPRWKSEFSISWARVHDGLDAGGRARCLGDQRSESVAQLGAGDEQCFGGELFLAAGEVEVERAFGCTTGADQLIQGGRVVALGVEETTGLLTILFPLGGGFVLESPGQPTVYLRTASDRGLHVDPVSRRTELDCGAIRQSCENAIVPTGKGCRHSGTAPSLRDRGLVSLDSACWRNRSDARSVEPDDRTCGAANG
jgi:hypothetical protein